MDTPSVSKTSTKLNLTHRQSSIFRSLLAIGNDMATVLRNHKTEGLLDSEATKLANKWEGVLQKLVVMFL